MYHAIGGSEERPSCFVVPLQRFQRQMRWLKWRGYAVISLSTLIAHRAAGTLPPARAVVITFDDGFADNHRHALPVLREHGFPATVFVVSGGIGATASWPGDAALLGRSLLSASQLQEMRAAGIEIGAHTRTHPSLTSLGPGAQHAEVAGSRAELTDRFGDINAFAYPFGDHDAATAERVASAGFAAACCSKSGINDPATPSFALRRLEVRGHDSLLTFAVMLWRGHRPRPVASRAALHEAAA
jgi:peptidoglycan/xylan/chitin deacetylase (PgdA/CDA1 family)